MNAKKGFSLIELLIVITILGVLATLGISTYMTSSQRGRDGKRKADLNTIQKGLEGYYNDFGFYPASTGASDLCPPATPSNCYLKTTPKDPLDSDYCYVLGSTGGTNQSFQLYARLEITDDPNIGSYSACGGTWTYGIASTNTTPATP